MKGSDVDPSHVLLFANGDLGPVARDIARRQAASHPRVVSVDGGLRHCDALGLVPELQIGDLDSVQRHSSVPTLAFPRDKDASDLELALEWLAAQTIERVSLFGLTGGRSDHMLFNWLLPARRAWPFRLQCIDDSVCATVVRHDQPYREILEAGQTVSLLPLGSGCRGVSTHGLVFPLDDDDLPVGSTRGLSNRVAPSAADGAGVSITQGVLLVLTVHAHTGQEP